MYFTYTYKYFDSRVVMNITVNYCMYDPQVPFN